jgi:hypothetical protein
VICPLNISLPILIISAFIDLFTSPSLIDYILFIISLKFKERKKKR